MITLYLVESPIYFLLPPLVLIFLMPSLVPPEPEAAIGGKVIYRGPGSKHLVLGN